jgi:hypothetical protein
VCSRSMQNEQRMRRVTLSSAACPALPYFLNYLINGTIFGENVIEHKMCVLIFFTAFVCRISYSEVNSARCYKCTKFFM